MPGQLAQRTFRPQDFLLRFGLESGRHQVGAEREFDVARALGFEHVVGGTGQLESGGGGQFAGLPVLELIERNVDAAQFRDFAPAVFEDSSCGGQWRSLRAKFFKSICGGLPDGVEGLGAGFFSSSSPASAMGRGCWCRRRFR